MRAEIRWKPGKDTQHLETRIKHGHLPDTATLNDYHAIIAAILNSDTADVYVYVWKGAVYPTVVDKHDDRCWLVMFSLAGVMETAFPPEDPDEYLADERFQRIGTAQELLP